MTEPVFESARLTMHHWTREDGEAFFRIWGDPRVVFWGGHAKSAADCVAAIERLRLRCSDVPGLGWFMVRKRDGESVANVVLQTAAFAPGEIEVGWHVEHASWGRGYATEAAQAALRYAVEELSLDKVVAAILPENKRSLRVAEKLDMRPAGDVVHAELNHRLLEWSAHS